MKQLIENVSLGILILFAAIPALGASYKLNGIEVDHAIAVPTVPAARTGAVYLTIANRNKAADRLLGASTPRARSVELHAMSMAGDIMRMREVKSIDLYPGQPVAMQPGSGNHLMLVDLGAPLKAGERFPLSLRFEKAGNLEVEVSVEQPSHAGDAQDAHRH